MIINHLKLKLKNYYFKNFFKSFFNNFESSFITLRIVPNDYFASKTINLGSISKGYLSH